MIYNKMKESKLIQNNYILNQNNSKKFHYFELFVVQVQKTYKCCTKE